MPAISRLSPLRLEFLVFGPQLLVAAVTRAGVILPVVLLSTFCFESDDCRRPVRHRQLFAALCGVCLMVSSRLWRKDNESLVSACLHNAGRSRMSDETAAIPDEGWMHDRLGLLRMMMFVRTRWHAIRRAVSLPLKRTYRDRSAGKQRQQYCAQAADGVYETNAGDAA